MKKETGKTGGWSQILDCMYARDGGGGGVIQMRTVWGVGGGGSTFWGEMRM